MKAIYADEHPVHYKGYPLLESQMPLHTRQDIEAELRLRNEFFNPVFLSYDRPSRGDILELWKTKFFILRDVHVDFAMALKRTVFSRYHGIDVFRPGYFAPSTDVADEREPSDDLDSEEETFPRNLAVIGESGSGKTSLLRSICKILPQVVVHNRYGDSKLMMKQLQYVRLICPKKSGAKPLWTNFYLGFNKALGQQIKTRGWTEADLEEKIAQDVKTSGLGFIIIDEIQNMLFGDKRTEELLAAFTRLNELCGVPLVFVGTPEIGKYIESAMHSARRAAGVVRWKTLARGEEWDKWFPEVLTRGLVQVPLPFTTEISEYFYDFSQGRVDAAVSLFIKAQQIALDGDREEIRGSDLDKAKEHLYLIANNLEKIREARRKKLQARLDAQSAEQKKAKKAGKIPVPNDPVPQLHAVM